MEPLEQDMPLEIPREELVIEPHFPEVVDNTIRSEMVMCLKKVQWGHIFQRAPRAPSVHLHAGGAFASGIEAARKSFWQHEHSKAEAHRDGLEALINFYGDVEFPPTRTGDKGLDNVIKAFDSYFSQYPLDRDKIKPFRAANGQYMIEFKFAIPTEVKNPQTGDPILYGGRCDMIGVMDDAIWVTDEKTASQLGESWAGQWDLDSQFTGYVAAAKEYGYPVAGALVRGVGLLKTKITHQEAIVTRNQWHIDRWWHQLHRDLRRMVAAWEEGYWDYAISKNACAAYGGCAFKVLCESPEPERWLPVQFRKRVWNPLAKDFGENLLENPEARKGAEAIEIDLKDLLP